MGTQDAAGILPFLQSESL